MKTYFKTSTIETNIGELLKKKIVEAVEVHLKKSNITKTMNFKNVEGDG